MYKWNFLNIFFISKLKCSKISIQDYFYLIYSVLTYYLHCSLIIDALDDRF